MRILTVSGLGLLFALLLVTGAAGVSISEVDTECQNNGFDFGIARWDWEGGGSPGAHYVEKAERVGYSTSVTGTRTAAHWTSEPAADGALSRVGDDYTTFPGGTSGDASPGGNIGRMVLCGNHTPPVPEFGILGATVVVAVLVGVAFWRRR